MKRSIKTLDQGAQNYMFTRKINYIWIINLILFIGVVFLGIEQAGRGAEISRLESQYEKVSVQKRELSENIFQNESESKLLTTQINSDYIKPSNIVYINSIDVVATLK